MANAHTNGQNPDLTTAVCVCVRTKETEQNRKKSNYTIRFTFRNVDIDLIDIVINIRIIQALAIVRE